MHIFLIAMSLHQTLNLSPADGSRVCTMGTNSRLAAAERIIIDEASILEMLQPVKLTPLLSGD